MIIFAIDPGKTGAIAKLENGVASFHKMPDNRYEIVNLFMEYKGKKCKAYIEHLHAGVQAQGARKGVKQIWSQAANYEQLMTALYVAEIPTFEISASKWMSKLPGTRPKEYKERKAWLYEKALKFYPDIKPPKYAADAFCLLHVFTELEK